MDITLVSRVTLPAFLPQSSMGVLSLLFLDIFLDGNVLTFEACSRDIKRELQQISLGANVSRIDWALSANAASLAADELLVSLTLKGIKMQSGVPLDVKGESVTSRDNTIGAVNASQLISSTVPEWNREMTDLTLCMSDGLAGHMFKSEVVVWASAHFGKSVWQAKTPSA